MGQKLLLIVVSLVLLMCLRCDKDNVVTEEGRLTIYLTDKPFPAELVIEANVNISRIEIRQKDESDGSSFITLSEDQNIFNLLELTNGITAKLVDMKVPIGSYDLIRLYVSEASVILIDSTEFDLTVPSGSQTGIKVFIKPDIKVVGGISADLLLDFEVSQSFVPQGNTDTPAGIKGFHFKPVIKATNLSNTGRLVGTVTDSSMIALEGAQIAVYANDTLNTTTFTDSDGEYSVLGLVSGYYNVFVERNGYDSQSVENVEIIAGNQTKLDFSLIPE